LKSERRYAWLFEHFNDIQSFVCRTWREPVEHYWNWEEPRPIIIRALLLLFAIKRWKSLAIIPPEFSQERVALESLLLDIRD
jgi:hypothetical protein